MLKQQESFKLGEWTPASGTYYCVACDRRSVESQVVLDEAQPFPFCPKCKEAGRDEVDQLWVRVEDRAVWRQREKTRWRELWK
jgi:hypothetical protein